MRVEYKNNQTGVPFDITSLVTAAVWSTARTGAPARLELTVLADRAVDWVHGGAVTLFQADRGLFYGYVFKLVRTQEETLSITAYDQTRYLKNKDTYILEGVRADQVLARIGADYQLRLGELPSTGYVIPSLICDSKTLFDTMLEVLEQTLTSTGRMFYLWDDFGALRLSEVTAPAELTVLGEDSLATAFSYESSIDGETYNKIKLVRDNKKTGRRDVYVKQDSGNVALWGILQLQEKVDGELNQAQIEQRCQQMLELHNQPERTLSLSALALPGLRAGQVIYCALPGIGIEQSFLVEEASHNLLEETMEVKVRVI